MHLCDSDVGGLAGGDVEAEGVRERSLCLVVNEELEASQLGGAGVLRLIGCEDSQMKGRRKRERRGKGTLQQDCESALDAGSMCLVLGWVIEVEGETVA